MKKAIFLFAAMFISVCSSVKAESTEDIIEIFKKNEPYGCMNFTNPKIIASVGQENMEAFCACKIEKEVSSLDTSFFVDEYLPALQKKENMGSFFGSNEKYAKAAKAADDYCLKDNNYKK